MEFSREDIERVRKQDRMEEITGAGAVRRLPFTDDTQLRLLEGAVERWPSAVLPRLVLTRRLLSRIANPSAEWDENQRVSNRLRASQHLKCLRDVDPGNSVYDYLEADLRYREGDLAAAAEIMRTASSRPRFDDHSSQIRYSIIKACEAAGYPAFTARRMASEFLSVSETCEWTVDQVLEWEGCTEETATDWLILGRRLETAAKFFYDHWVAFRIQERALGWLESPKLAEEKQRIQARRDTLSPLADGRRWRMMGRIMTEEEWIDYFDLLFRQSQETANIAFIAKMMAVCDFDQIV